MALSIKNREVEALARELARLTRKPITEAVRDSLKRDVDRARIIAKAKPKEDDLVEEMLAIGREIAAMPTVSSLTDDEILGYDEFGAPTR